MLPETTCNPHVIFPSKIWAKKVALYTEKCGKFSETQDNSSPSAPRWEGRECVLGNPKEQW